MRPVVFLNVVVAGTSQSRRSGAYCAHATFVVVAGIVLGSRSPGPWVRGVGGGVGRQVDGGVCGWRVELSTARTV